MQQQARATKVPLLARKSCEGKIRARCTRGNNKKALTISREIRATSDTVRYDPIRAAAAIVFAVALRVGHFIFKRREMWIYSVLSNEKNNMTRGQHCLIYFKEGMEQQYNLGPTTRPAIALAWYFFNLERHN